MIFFKWVKNFFRPNIIKLNSLYIAKIDRNTEHNNLSIESDETDREKKLLLSNVEFLIAALVLLIDQLSKLLVINSINSEEYIELLPFFNIVFVKNTGVTFGMLRETAPPFVFALSSVAIVALLLAWTRNRVCYQLPAVLIASGAIGNAIDRLAHGAVIDFLDFHLLGYHWPAFNIADSAIVVGTLILLFISYGEET
jgi:signal peptidase II